MQTVCQHTQPFLITNVLNDIIRSEKIAKKAKLFKTKRKNI